MEPATMLPDRAVIAPVEAGQLPALEALPWSAGLRTKHRARLERQGRGEADYLIASLDGAPVGHLLLHWTGPQDAAIAARLPDCAEIEDFVVRADLRSRGLGRRMLARAEELARRRGLRHLGLGVGLGNPRARALYEAAGFRDAGLGVYVVRWQYRGQDGQLRWGEESCHYLIKAPGEDRHADRGDDDEQEGPMPQRGDTPTGEPSPAPQEEPTPAALDPVEEADLESFPASDPPSWAGGGDPVIVRTVEEGDEDAPAGRA